MGKKKGQQRGKPQGEVVAWGGGGVNEQQPANNSNQQAMNRRVTQTNPNANSGGGASGELPFWEKQSAAATQQKQNDPNSAAGFAGAEDGRFVDFGNESQKNKKGGGKQDAGAYRQKGIPTRQVYQAAAAQQPQPAFMNNDYDQQQQNQQQQQPPKQHHNQQASHHGQHRQVHQQQQQPFQQSAYQHRQQQNQGYHNNNNNNGGYGQGGHGGQGGYGNNQGGGQGRGKRNNNNNYQAAAQVSNNNQRKVMTEEERREQARQERFITKQPAEPRIEAPKIDEAVKEQIRKEYAEFDLDELLMDPKEAASNEESKAAGAGEKQYTIDQSKQQIHSLFSQLQNCMSASKATKLPSIETHFGGEAIQPLQPPMFFNLGEDDRNFEVGIGPWRLSRDQIVSKMLLRDSSQVKADTFDTIFKFDSDELKRKAAADIFRYNDDLQAEVRAKMNAELDLIESKLTESTNIELSAIGLETLAKVNVASGLLSEITFDELKEPFELEPEFDEGTDVKAILMQQRLQDEQEIDQLLESALDPFAAVPEDDVDAAESDQLICKFLNDMRDLDVLQQHQEMFKEKQLEQKETAGFKAQQMMEKQQQLAEASDGEDEESKAASSTDAASRQQSAAQMIDTSDGASHATNNDSVMEEESKTAQVDLDQIDEILEESKDYQRAVSEQQKYGQSASRLQAEPSHFHLAALAQERRVRPLKKITQAAPVDGEETKEENWVVTDKISMVNFKQLVQDPAIVYPFELDDFQKRAVYRLEQGNCVMVAAHTSAGKTLVAEYAIALSRRHMTKTIYTSPIKSLSNQKYRDFKLKFGDVGMLTGDVQLNNDASCLIMTTEILQQMLYNDSSRIADVEWVIFDEVHYINDEQRGSVWEEVIIKLPDTVSIVMLSATVPNYLEFAQWVGRVKQKKIYVQYTQERPVPLQHNSIIDGKMVPLKQQNKPVDQQALKDCSKQRGILRNKSMQEKNNQKGGGADQSHQKKGQQQQANDPNQRKKIDFKEKAIKAKENSVKKVIAKNMKQSGGKGPSTGAGQNVNGKKKSNFEKTLLSIQKMNLLPTIVFAFSRAGTVQYAEELDPQIDFTDGYTKGLIKKFIKQKIQRLDEADRDLPQILLLTKLMSRGIGIHHAGLLQILKELVEILFSDGYLKVVFATSTFAIGLNLPARSVVFTGLKKFDGSDFGTISTSEYLQMAGRAGRRGKDDCGFSVLCMDPGHQVPPNSDLVELLESKGIELESKLNVNYDMCLNSLKQDTDEFGTMLKNSFFANETATVKIQARQKKKRIEPIYERALDLQCVFGAQDEIKSLYELIDLLWNANEEIAGGLTPMPLQIVQLVTEKHLFKNAIVLRNINANRSLVCIFTQVGESMPISYEEDNPNGDFQSASQHNQTKTVPVPGTQGEILAYEVTEISNCMITQTYNEQVVSLKEKHLNFLHRTQLAEKQIKLLAKDYHQYQNQLSIAPVSFGGGKKKTKSKMQNLVSKREEILNQIRKTKCWNCEQVSYHLTQLEVQDKYKQQMMEIDQILQGNVDEKEADFNNRNGILTHYKIIDEDLNILFKGKVAMQACQDKVLLTEFFFSGLINDLSDQELLAILSVFVTTEKASGNVADCGKQYSEKFTEAFEFVEAQANALIQLEQDAGVMEEQIITKRLNFKFYELVYDWADQKCFKDVVEDTGIDEGSVIKMIMAVNRTRQAIEKMATVVGDNALATRMVEMEALINRGIVKMQSLYLEVEQEPQRLNEREEDFALNFDQETGQVKSIGM